MRLLRTPHDGDVRFWRMEPGCSVVLSGFGGFVELDFAMVPRIGAAQLNLNGKVQHHLASAHARADNTLILHTARHVTMCVESHKPFIVSRRDLGNDVIAYLHSLGTDEHKGCRRKTTDAVHDGVQGLGNVR